MTVFITTDTHFGHMNLVTKYKQRPDYFSDKLYNAWKEQVTDADTVIHLGDISFDNEWLCKVGNLPGKKILVRGNHDRKPENWYLEHGWTFVCTSFSKRIGGIDVLFSHEPVTTHTHDINIHGHLHSVRSVPSLSPCYHVSLELDWGYSTMPTLPIVMKRAEAYLRTLKPNGYGDNGGDGEIIQPVDKLSE